MRTRMILAAALSGLLVTPAFAADTDYLAVDVGQQWQAVATAQGNLQRALAALMQDRAAQHKQIAELLRKCGDRCQDAPPAAPVAPAAPTESAKP